MKKPSVQHFPEIPPLVYLFLLMVQVRKNLQMVLDVLPLVLLLSGQLYSYHAHGTFLPMVLKLFW